MTPKEQLIVASKEFRKAADELLQRMKSHKSVMMAEGQPEKMEDKGEAIANHVISIRALEDCIMRQGMTLKNIGTPDPYPESRNPESTIVEPTADGLKL